MAIDLDDLGERIATHAANLDAATHTLLTDLRVFDHGGGWHKQGARSCAHWLSWRLGWNLGTAREHVRVALKLAELPQVDDALRRGAISYCKVRAITRVATPANEAALLTDAEFSTGAQLERICRKYAAVLAAEKSPDQVYDRDRRYVRRVDLDDGMVKLEAVLHPEEAALVWTALEAIGRSRSIVPAAGAADASVDTKPPVEVGPDHEGAAVTTANMTGNTDDRSLVSADSDLEQDRDNDARDANDIDDDTYERERAARAAADRALMASARATRTWVPFHRADALVAMAQALLRGDRVERTPIELVVTVTAEALANSASAVLPLGIAADGSCVSAETARRLACDCGVVQVREDAQGAALSVGRKTRTIPSSIKRALLQRDSCCRFPGCTNRLFVEAHHIEHWADGGETSLENLVVLCTHHHRFLHEYGYRVQLDAQRQPTFFDARGRAVPNTGPRPVLDVPGMRTIEHDNRALGVSAETNQPRWDGRPVDYDLVVEDLLRF